MNPYIRLAEAIERGAKLRPQCRGAMFKDGGSCALGAAFEAIFGHTRTHDHGGCKLGKWLGINRVGFLFVKITYKNDALKKTREEIAAWLRTLPEAQDTQPSTATLNAAPSTQGVGQGEAASQWATEQVKKLLEGVAA